MEALTIFALVGALLLAFYVHWRIYMRKYRLGVPGPEPLPFIGTMHHFMKNTDVTFFDFLTSQQKQYGKMILSVGLGLYHPQPFIFMHDPEIIKHFLQTNFKNYIRHTANHRFHTLFGTGIFVSNGAHWKKQRQTARPLFTPHSLQEVHDVFVQRSQKVLELLEESRTSGQSIDLQNLFMRYTLDSIGEVGFGYNIDSLSKPVAFSQAFDRAQAIADKNNRNPFLRSLPDAEFDKCVNIMRSFTSEIIQKRRQDTNLAERKDMLSRFMLARDPDTNEPLSDEMLIDILLNFFIAGRDTTAILLTWTFYMLMQNPEVQAKLVAEIDSELKGEVPTWEKLKELKYLRKVLDETLRLYPSVPVDGRTAVEEDVLPNGIKVPPGTALLYSPYVLGRMEEYWDEPLRFNPDRWDKPPKHPFLFVSFHAGPQTCLGRPLAYQEAETMVCLILQRYTFSLVPGHVVVPTKAIVMPAKYGLQVEVHNRKDIKA